ncbi:MAG: LacI family DNA-binding transcriptional regulator [Caldilineaceae bacterium]|nr:LacI family DNA-binding transcriptional regulator [Caldilineaceae bacterium]
MHRKPTILDVARLAGVSKSTVSRVLQGNDAPVAETTRQQVLVAMEQLGYAHNAVASSLRTNRTNMVMLLIPNIDNPFWPGVARGLQDTLAAAGYAVVFANSDWNAGQEKALLEMARRNRFDAIAINPAYVPPAELAALGVPTVILGLRQHYAEFDMAGSDSYQGTLLALHYLYQLGHRRIGLIGGNRGNSRSRLRAYHDFHASRKLPVDEELIAAAPYTVEGGRLAAEQLLRQDRRPTAIFAANDVLALAAIQVAFDLRLRVPKDISIVGMDDIESAGTSTPRLTTVAKDKYEIGRRAARFLLARLDGLTPAEPQRAVVACRLIERQSAGPPQTQAHSIRKEASS